MIEIGRREVLAGMAAVAVAPPRATDADLALRARLDSLASLPSPAAKLRALAGVGEAGLSAGARLDLVAAREGLAIDVRLAELLPMARPGHVPPQAGAPGLWRRPNGMMVFELLVDRQFGATGDATAIHRRLLDEGAKLTAHADALTRKMGYPGATVAERIVAAYRDPAHLYPDSDAGRDAAVADMNRWLAVAVARVPALVGAVPPECLHVAARRMTPAEEAAGKAGYRTLPKPDGTPGAYFVDLKDIRRRPRWSLGSVVHHELIPGHMIQMPIEARAAPHPLRMEYVPAWQEGWAIHAEAMMAGDGAWAHDDRLALGHVHWMLFRVARGLLDTGIHTQRWSLDEARRQVAALMGEPAYFASFDQDIARVVTEPGVRAGEALAWLCIGDASHRADNARAFHQAMLAHGRMRRTSLETLARA